MTTSFIAEPSLFSLPSCAHTFARLTVGANRTVGPQPIFQVLPRRFLIGKQREQLKSADCRARHLVVSAVLDAGTISLRTVTSEAPETCIRAGRAYHFLAAVRLAFGAERVCGWNCDGSGSGCAINTDKHLLVPHCADTGDVAHNLDSLSSSGPSPRRRDGK